MNSVESAFGVVEWFGFPPQSMDPIATFAGFPVTIADVYSFVIAQVVPLFLGVFGSWLTEVAKRSGWIPVPSKWPDSVKRGLLRGVVAVVCVGLNAAVSVTNGMPLSAAILWQSFLSYLTAVTTFEHMVKKSPSEPA